MVSGAESLAGLSVVELAVAVVKREVMRELEVAMQADDLGACSPSEFSLTRSSLRLGSLPLD
jgi:hypothetical protein